MSLPLSLQDPFLPLLDDPADLAHSFGQLFNAALSDVSSCSSACSATPALQTVTCLAPNSGCRRSAHHSPSDLPSPRRIWVRQHVESVLSELAPSQLPETAAVERQDTTKDIPGQLLALKRQKQNSAARRHRLKKRTMLQEAQSNLSISQLHCASLAHKIACLESETQELRAALLSAMATSSSTFPNQMGNWASNAPKISSKDKAILELKVQRDKLKQYEKKIQLVIEKELAVAKEQLAKKNHHAARLALSKKKYQEQLLEKTGQQLMNIEQLTGTIEYALVEKEIIEKLALGNSVLKQIHQEMDLTKVEKIMDDTAEGIAYQKEIEEAMSREFSPEDEDAIMAELDKLVEQEIEENIKILPTVPTNDRVDENASVPDLPDVPLHDPMAKQTAASESGTVR
ncbi:Vacuolar protein sorting-associated protein 20 [Kappamyces sp. JEL0680]|nr:Vacuolar protein sorting-associated protein 20 [Kappamyces sp. JEL0680]